MLISYTTFEPHIQLLVFLTYLIHIFNVYKVNTKQLSSNKLTVTLIIKSLIYSIKLATKHIRPNIVIIQLRSQWKLINSCGKDMTYCLICIHEFYDPLNMWPGAYKLCCRLIYLYYIAL